MKTQFISPPKNIGIPLLLSNCKPGTFFMLTPETAEFLRDRWIAEPVPLISDLEADVYHLLDGYAPGMNSYGASSLLRGGLLGMGEGLMTVLPVTEFSLMQTAP